MRDYYSFKTKEILGKRSIKKGDVILTSEPFVYIIDSQYRGQYCDHCVVSSRNKSLKPCKQCGDVFYCSEACEQAGIEVHDQECKYTKRLQPYTAPNFARLLARLIFRLKNGGDTYVEYYGEKKPRRFKDLMNHYRDIKDDENRMSDVESLYEILKKIVGEDNLPYETDFIGLYGRVLVNRFCLMDSHMCPIGSVVYLAGSIFDHSCIPNAYASFIGTKLEVRSLVDVPILDYNKVFISYIDMMKTTAQRREELQTNWYFWCECSLCVNNDRHIFESCIKCATPNCGAPIPVKEKWESQIKSNFDEAPLACLVCNCPVEEDFLKEYQSAVAFTKECLKGLKEESPAIDVCLTMLEKQGNLFSAVNVWRVRALDFAFNGAYVNGIYGLAINYGRQNAEGMRFFYGSEHPTFGLFLMKLGKSLLYLKVYREGLTVVEEAERILTVALGEKHALVESEINRLKMIANEDVDIYMERRIMDKERAAHELVCKHCGRRKNQANKQKDDENERSLSLNGTSKHVNKNDVYASIEALKVLTETLSKNNIPNHVPSVVNVDIFASLANGPNGNVFSKVFSKLAKKKNEIKLDFGSESNETSSQQDKKLIINHTDKLETNGNSNNVNTNNYQSNMDRYNKSVASKPVTNGDTLSTKQKSKTHRSKLLRSEDCLTIKEQENNLNKPKLERRSALPTLEEEKMNNKSSTTTSNPMGTKSIPVMERSENSVTAYASSTANNFSTTLTLKEADKDKVIMPSSLTRLLRYGDKLGIATKSKTNRDSVYCLLKTSNTKQESTLDYTKPVISITEKITHVERVTKEESTPLKAKVTEFALKDNDQENKKEEKAELKQSEQKQVEQKQIEQKLSPKTFKKEKSEECLVVIPDNPREKIERLYTKEIEQKWGLDYVPEKVPTKSTNKYKLAETNKIWEKFISDADVRWARYIAEIEFNNLMAQETSDSDKSDVELE